MLHLNADHQKPLSLDLMEKKKLSLIAAACLDFIRKEKTEIIENNFQWYSEL